MDGLRRLLLLACIFSIREGFTDGINNGRPLEAWFRLGRPCVKSLGAGPSSDAFGGRSISVSAVYQSSKVRAWEDDERVLELLGCFWCVAGLEFIV